MSTTKPDYLPITATITRVDKLSLSDTLVTRHGRNYGTVEIDSIEYAPPTAFGERTVRVSGYETINAGRCGPWTATLLWNETVEVAEARLAADEPPLVGEPPARLEHDQQEPTR